MKCTLSLAFGVNGHQKLMIFRLKSKYGLNKETRRKFGSVEQEIQHLLAILWLPI